MASLEETRKEKENLIRLGVNPTDAFKWSRTRKGGWAVAQSPILSTTITVEGLKKRAVLSCLERYRKIYPQHNEPL